MKKIFSVLLAVITACCCFVFAANAEEAAVQTPSFIAQEDNGGLYVHAASGNDTEAWQRWQSALTEEGFEVDPFVKYFFLPSGASDSEATVYNNFTYDVTINGTTIPSKSVAAVKYAPNTGYNVKLELTEDGSAAKLYFLKSTAEAAIYVNNKDADGGGTELYAYLSADKSNSAKATGAIVGSDGSIDNTTVKKIKGRGNTTWGKPKKPFNITYDSKVSIGNMEKGKKFSLLANYQDGSLLRNRLLYDLSDAVGMPYASDSRFVDFYINGVYYGSYQCCQKIEVGSSDVVNDIDDGAYLNSDNTLAADFPFLMEIDPSYDRLEDYHVSASSNDITIKAPELTADMDFYSEVKEYVKSKFTELYSAVTSSATQEQLSAIMDVDSFAKLYLINELGKNWDSGVSSLYMVYKQDSQGNWKFFASPVWDYDNSLGNAAGVESELRGCGVTDYQDYSGWWCKYKGKRAASKTSSNFMNRCANCAAIQKRAAQLWVSDFIPALNTFNSEGVTQGEIFSNDVYFNILKGSAQMNYARGWLVNTGDWIADHSKLKKASYDFGTDAYAVAGDYSFYTADFTGEYNYAADWMNSRAAWLTNQFTAILADGDVDGNGRTDINDATLIQRISLCYSCTDRQRTLADFNADGRVNILDVTALQKKLAYKSEY